MENPVSLPSTFLLYQIRENRNPSAIFLPTSYILPFFVPTKSTLGCQELLGMHKNLQLEHNSSLCIFDGSEESVIDIKSVSLTSLHKWSTIIGGASIPSFVNFVNHI